MERYITEELDKLASLGLKRSLRKISGPQGPRVVIDGRSVLLFCSNDYLGLAGSPELKEAAIRATEKYGTGAGASRLVSGSMEPHFELEERLKNFKGTEAALLFNSGYNANLGVITALAGRNTEIFSDKLNHASIVDACVLSRASVKRFASCDAGSLERALKKSAARDKIVVTEGVFSMDGNVAPLPDIISLCSRYGATLVLDDAHATGVLGGGRGTLEHFGIKDHSGVVQMGTLGKAVGSFGAFIAGDKKLIELLVSRARPFIYTTALPPGVCAAACRGLDLIETRPELRRRLNANSELVRGALKAAGLDTLTSATQIVPVFIGGPRRATGISAALLERGIFIQAIRPPTVPQGTARLRVTVTAAHTEADIMHAASAIKDAFAERGQSTGGEIE